MLPAALGVLLSLAIEIIQVYTPLRTPSVTDVLFNGSGAIAGVAIASMARGFTRSRLTVKGPRDRMAAVLLCSGVASLLFPFFPVLSRTIVSHKLALFWASPALSVVPFVSTAVTWFVSGRLLIAVKIPAPVVVLACAILMIPVQFFVLGRQPVLSMLLGAVAGLTAFAAASRSRATYAPAALVLAMLVVQGLSPFRWQEAGNVFTWTPFGGVLAADWQYGILFLIEKTFYYGMALWTLTRAGLRFSTAVIAIAAIAVTVEAAQVHLPGRTPDITDPLLVVLVGFTFRMLKNPTIAGRRVNG